MVQLTVYSSTLAYIKATISIKEYLEVVSRVSGCDRTASNVCLQVGKKILVGCVRHVESGVVVGPRVGDGRAADKTRWNAPSVFGPGGRRWVMWVLEESVENVVAKEVARMEKEVVDRGLFGGEDYVY